MPDDLLVCRWMCIFVQETRKENGEEYPSSTIRALSAAFQRQMTTNKVGFSLLDKAKLRFYNLHNTLDALCVSLRKKGIGATKTYASVICPEDEIQMWESGVLGVDNPWSLARATFFVVGLHLCLRGGQEHWDLAVSQFRRFPSDVPYSADSYQYAEYGSKNHQRKFDEGNANKVSHAYVQPESDKSPVRILDLYLLKLPSNPKAFYLEPLPEAPTDPGKPLYTPWV